VGAGVIASCSYEARRFGLKAGMALSEARRLCPRAVILDGHAQTYRCFAEKIFEQVKGFGSYGFPESHAASFALLTYASCWLKCHEPAAFACALLNAQPLGFYTTAQIVQDARKHSIAVRPVDVRYSEVDSSLEDDASARTSPHFAGALPQPAIRLGLREVGSLPKDAAERIVASLAASLVQHTEPAPAP